MKSVLTIPLNTSPEQLIQVKALQSAFADVCNALAPVVQETRCWNRVALHHMTYRNLREQFPHIGSQMVCNAIYSVSRMCRIVFQHPNSPWHISKLGDRPLPGMKFSPTAPVYFDRHTLSLKNGRLSMYTLDGRIHFDINLGSNDEARFHQEKLREVVLETVHQGLTLSFHFSAKDGSEIAETRSGNESGGELPEYLLVIESGDSAFPPATPSHARRTVALASHL